MSEQAMHERLSVLQQQHQQLSTKVDRLERRAHLTPKEQREVADLKKRKLLTKDELSELKRAM